MGFIIAGVRSESLVVLDGIISQAAAIIACELKNEIKPALILSHLSAEPSAKYLTQYFGSEPLLDLGLRLGEGTGGVLATALIRAGLESFFGMKKISALMSGN